MSQRAPLGIGAMLRVALALFLAFLVGCSINPIPTPGHDGLGPGGASAGDAGQAGEPKVDTGSAAGPDAGAPPPPEDAGPTDDAPEADDVLPEDAPSEDADAPATDDDPDSVETT